MAIAAAAVAGVALLGACNSWKEDRGVGDAPVGKSNDSAAYVINMPDTFMNLAWRCVGENGIYTHTREAAPVIVPADPNCAEGGLWERLDMPTKPDRVRK